MRFEEDATTKEKGCIPNITFKGIDVEFPTKLEEIRIVDPNSGGEKGSKLARFSLIPADFLWALAEHYGIGAKKYDDDNWRKGYRWRLSYDALQRHLSQWVMGEDKDEETGSHHLVSAAWHCIALWWFQKYNKGTDNLTARSENK